MNEYATAGCASGLHEWVRVESPGTVTNEWYTYRCKHCGAKS